jgi:hypothetical protein
MHPLIAIHAALGEVGALAFLWVVVELLSPTETRIRRARRAALLGLVFLVASLIVAGYYYLGDYQSIVKPVIKAGPVPWAHSVVTETKEHVFFFIPLLAALAWGLLKRYGSALLVDGRLRVATIAVAASVTLLSFAMAGMGFIMSSGFRAALEATAL